MIIFRGAELLEELSREALERKNEIEAKVLEKIRVKMLKMKETYKGYLDEKEVCSHTDGTHIFNSLKKIYKFLSGNS